MCVCARVRVSYQEKTLFEFFVYFLNWVVFLLLSFNSYSYILDASSLSHIWSENIFSHSVDCLFIAKY